MTLRRMWILSAVMATLWCGLLAICESHADMNTVFLCFCLGFGGYLALYLTDPIRPMLGLGERGQTHVLDHVVVYAGNWIVMCIIFLLILLGLRTLKRVVRSKLRI